MFVNYILHFIDCGYANNYGKIIALCVKRKV